MRALQSGQECVRHATLEKHVVFLVIVVIQWVIVVNQRILVVSLWCLSRVRPKPNPSAAAGATTARCRQ
jgi:hypothetical protein